MFEAIVATTYTAKTSTETIQKQEKETDTFAYILMAVVGFIWLIIYFIGSN